MRPRVFPAEDSSAGGASPFPAPHQLVQARRRQVDVAHDDDLRGLFEPGSRQLLVIHRHNEGLARLGHLRTAGLDVQRQCVGTGHGNRTRDWS